MRLRAAPKCVVIVRADGSWQPLADVLMTAFAVRLAATTAELMEHLVPIERLACVCVVNEGVRLRDVHDTLVRAGGAPERIMFVSGDDMSSPAALDEILRAVQRLGAWSAT